MTHEQCTSTYCSESAGCNINGIDDWEDEMKRQGAIEALAELKTYLLHCGASGKCNQQLSGLLWSIDAISRRISDLEPETKGGAA